MTDNLLSKINSPADLKPLSITQLIQLADEARREIIENVSDKGGHLASSLGAVELTIALHYVLKAPVDAIVWDVGHQVYTHKLLTGRRDKFNTLRQLGGLSGFPSKNEGPYDLFTTGHSSAAISTALGYLAANDLKGAKRRVVAVVGDAALAGGMSFEALNHAGHIKKNLIIILNDNAHSISRTVGGLSKYLNRIITNPLYNRTKKDVQNLVKKIPRFGFGALKAARKLEEGLKNLLVPGIVFEEMGFQYFGPIDGHDMNTLVSTFNKVFSFDGPILIHVITKKGKGYKPAEQEPTRYHSSPLFEPDTGEVAKSKSGSLSYTDAFGRKLVELARENTSIVAISAAMPDGTGLVQFAERYPGRFFDVGIAEEHGVGFAAGLARGGLVPVVAIYSTFMQRAYDQIVHDVCLQNLHVVMCLDRAGLVGEDGPTHHGAFDIVYLRHLPNMTVMAPKDTDELQSMLDFAVNKCTGPVAIRYPRGASSGSFKASSPIQRASAERITDGKDAVIFALGSMVSVAVQAAGLLKRDGIDAAVINGRFVKPLDEKTLTEYAKKAAAIVTIEEGAAAGGYGSAILESLEREGLSNINIRCMGLPDSFVQHGNRDALLEICGLTKEMICENVKDLLKKAHTSCHT